MAIYINDSANYTVSATASSNTIIISEVNPRLLIGMPLVYVSGTDAWQSGTEIQAISYGVTNTTVTLTKHAVATGSSTIRFTGRQVSPIVGIDTTTATDKFYSRGLRGDRVFKFTVTGGSPGAWTGTWSNGASHTLVSGKLYKIIEIVYDNGIDEDFDVFGDVVDASNRLYRSNGTQPTQVSVSGFQSFTFMPVISNGLSTSFTRISAENTDSFGDITSRESKLPIFVGGSTADEYRLKVIDPNSITRARFARYIVTSGTIDTQLVFNAIRRSSGSSSAQCHIAMAGGGGGGAGGRTVSQDGAAGGGGAGWRLFRTQFPGIWTTGAVGSAGTGQVIDSTSPGGNGGSSSISGGGNTISVGGGSGGSWSGNDGIGGGGGTNSSGGVTLSLYLVAGASIHNIGGPSGGNSRSVGRGFNNNDQQQGLALSATTLSYFGNLYSNSTNANIYGLYEYSIFDDVVPVNNGPLTARNGGASGGGILNGNGGGGGASAYANGGRGAEAGIPAGVGSYGSGGGGGRSGGLSIRTPGANGGSGVMMFFS